MSRLVTCVPNFSEGRDPAFLPAMVEAIESVPAVLVLDQTQDPDHHRSVVTCVGPPEVIGEAAFRAVRLASERIDLRKHHGVHPRVGATDVLPFVPFKGVGMQECIDLAHALAARIGRELEIPVFLYEEAATQPARKALEAVRRGGLSGLTARMRDETRWKPDYGPAQPHPSAGVTVVGARPVLVAWNVNLASTDLALAKSIARAVRASNGGLPAVKAIGVELASRARVQVSMNLVNLDITPVHVAVEAVRHHAEQAGVSVAESELIGLIPERVLIAAAQAPLGLDRFSLDHILEHRLARVRDERAGWAGLPLGDLLALFGGTKPTPAGASLAGLVGAFAAQLAAKLARIVAKDAGDGHELERLQALRDVSRKLCRLAEADADAYAAVLRQSRATVDPHVPEAGTQEGAEGQERIVRATEIPLHMAELLLGLLTDVIQAGKPSARSLAVDAVIVDALVLAALRASLLVVDNNIKSMKNHELSNGFMGRKRKIESCLEGLKGLC